MIQALNIRSDGAMTEDEKKAEAIHNIETAGEQARTLGEILKHAQAGLRLIQDTAGPLADIYKAIPADMLPAETWETQNHQWGEWNQIAKSHLDHFEMTPAATGVAYSTVNSAISGVSGYITHCQPAFTIQDTFGHLMETVSKQDLSDKAIQSMKRLGLDRRAGDHRSAVELLQEAKAAVERPPVEDGGNSVLMPLRESLDITISELLKKRPGQGKMKGWKDKIMAIGTDCGRSALPTTYFDKCGDDASTLWGELSGAKQSILDRTQVIALFHRGVLTLNTLLEGIDKGKLRP
jgi:hypothetical protein